MERLVRNLQIGRNALCNVDLRTVTQHIGSKKDVIAMTAPFGMQESMAALPAIEAVKSIQLGIAVITDGPLVYCSRRYEDVRNCCHL